MQIDVRGRGMVVPEEIVGDVEERLRAAVTKIQPPVRALLVRIVDDNGPRGGEDKRCVVVARGSSAGSTVVSARGVTILGAVGAAADALGRTMRDANDRKKDRKREREWRRGSARTLSPMESQSGGDEGLEAH